MQVAGVDVGGTNIGAGLVDQNHAVVADAKIETPRSGPELVDAVVELVHGLGGDPVAVGLAIPGVVDRREVLVVPNLPGWDGDFDIATLVEKRLGLPVALGNDANVGVIGEWLAGAAVGHDQVLGVWMGTGIGGGLILDGRPYRGARGGAGELGHMVVRQGGALCGCGRRGCVEAYGGRAALARAVDTMVAAGHETRLFEIQEEEGKGRLTSRVWAIALAEGDTVAVELFDTAIDALAAGIGSVVNMLDVELVVIGGGMAEKLGQDLADRIGEAAGRWILHRSPDLRFVVAQLGDDSGIVGAASLGRALAIAR